MWLQTQRRRRRACQLSLTHAGSVANAACCMLHRKQHRLHRRRSFSLVSRWSVSVRCACVRASERLRACMCVYVCGVSERASSCPYVCAQARVLLGVWARACVCLRRVFVHVSLSVRAAGLAMLTLTQKLWSAHSAAPSSSADVTPAASQCSDTEPVEHPSELLLHGTAPPPPSPHKWQARISITRFRDGFTAVTGGRACIRRRASAFT
jgi:hypothetical protein